MIEIWFIRHGQASFGADDYDRLSSAGIRQSELLGKYLSAAAVRFDRVWSGTMRRQKDTAVYALGGTLPELDPGFNEFDAETVFRERFPAEAARLGMPADIDAIVSDRKLFQSVFSRIMHQWVNAEISVQGVTPYDNHLLHLGKSLARVLEAGSPGQRIGIFTSGGVISMVLQICLDISPSNALRYCWQIKNSSVTRMTAERQTPDRDGADGIDRFNLSLAEFNSLVHLEPENDSGLITFR